VAEESAAPKAAAAPETKAGGKPILLYALVALNMLVVAGVGAMVYMGKQKEAKEPGIKDVIQGEREAQQEEKEKKRDDDLIGTTVPLEQFLVNLAGNRGRGLLKVNMELEVDGPKVMEEIERRKPQLRDMIIILLSSKTYQQVSSTEGKDLLREDIRDNVNSFLTQGKIKKVLFTEFIYD
jgi:flagellar FliL protein